MCQKLLIVGITFIVMMLHRETTARMFYIWYHHKTYQIKDVQVILRLAI